MSRNGASSNGFMTVVNQVILRDPVRQQQLRDELLKIAVKGLVQNFSYNSQDPGNQINNEMLVRTRQKLFKHVANILQYPESNVAEAYSQIENSKNFELTAKDELTLLEDIQQRIVSSAGAIEEGGTTLQELVGMIGGGLAVATPGPWTAASALAAAGGVGALCSFTGRNLGHYKQQVPQTATATQQILTSSILNWWLPPEWYAMLVRKYSAFLSPDKGEIEEEIRRVVPENMRQLLHNMLNKDTAAFQGDEKALTNLISSLTKSNENKQIHDYLKQLLTGLEQKEVKSQEEIKSYLRENLPILKERAHLGIFVAELFIGDVLGKKKLAADIAAGSRAVVEIGCNIVQVVLRNMSPWVMIFSGMETLHKLYRHFSKGGGSPDESALQQIRTDLNLVKSELHIISDQQRQIISELADLTKNFQKNMEIINERLESISQQISQFRSEYQRQIQSESLNNLQIQAKKFKLLSQRGMSEKEYSDYLLKFYKYANLTARTPVYSGYNDRNLSEEKLMEEIGARRVDGVFGLFPQIVKYMAPELGHKVESLPNPIAFYEGATLFIEACFSAPQFYNREFDELLSNLLYTAEKLRESFELFADPKISKAICSSFGGDGSADIKEREEKHPNTIGGLVRAELKDHQQQYKQIPRSLLAFDDPKSEIYFRGYPLPEINIISEQAPYQYEEIIAQAINHNINAFKDMILFCEIPGMAWSYRPLYAVKQGDNPLKKAQELGLVEIVDISSRRNPIKKKIKFNLFTELTEIEFIETEHKIRARTIAVYYFGTGVSFLLKKIDQLFKEKGMALPVIPDFVNTNNATYPNSEKRITLLDIIHYLINGYLFLQRHLFAEAFIEKLKQNESTLMRPLKRKLLYQNFIIRMRGLAEKSGLSSIPLSISEQEDFYEKIRKTINQDFRRERLNQGSRRWNPPSVKPEDIQREVNTVVDGWKENEAKQAPNIEDVSLQEIFIDPMINALYLLAYKHDVRLTSLYGLTVSEAETPFSGDECKALLRSYVEDEKSLHIDMRSEIDLSRETFIQNLVQYPQVIWIIALKERVAAIYGRNESRQVFYIDYASAQMPEAITQWQEEKLERLPSAQSQFNPFMPAAEANIYLLASLIRLLTEHPAAEEKGSALEERDLRKDPSFKPMQVKAAYCKRIAKPAELVVQSLWPSPESVMQSFGSAVIGSTPLMFYMGGCYGFYFLHQPQSAFFAGLALKNFTHAAVYGQMLGATAVAGNFTGDVAVNVIAPLYASHQSLRPSSTASLEKMLAKRKQQWLIASVLTGVFSFFMAGFMQRRPNAATGRNENFNWKAAGLHGFVGFIGASLYHGIKDQKKGQLTSSDVGFGR